MSLILDFGASELTPLTSIIFYGSRPDISGDAFVDKPEFGDFISLTSITYCDENNGWPGETIEGITPQLDETCEAQSNLSEPIQYAALDLDQNGSFDALTDALMIMRYAFGLRGDALISNAIASDANRTSAEEIEAHIQSLLP